MMLLCLISQVIWTHLLDVFSAFKRLWMDASSRVISMFPASVVPTQKMETHRRLRGPPVCNCPVPFPHPRSRCLMILRHLWIFSFSRQWQQKVPKGCGCTSSPVTFPPSGQVWNGLISDSLGDGSCCRRCISLTNCLVTKGSPAGRRG